MKFLALLTEIFDLIPKSTFRFEKICSFVLINPFNFLPKNNDGRKIA